MSEDHYNSLDIYLGTVIVSEAIVNTCVDYSLDRLNISTYLHIYYDFVKLLWDEIESCALGG